MVGLDVIVCVCCVCVCVCVSALFLCQIQAVSSCFTCIISVVLLTRLILLVEVKALDCSPRGCFFLMQPHISCEHFFCRSESIAVINTNKANPWNEL